MPSRLYKNVIAAGARQNQLPPEYIAFLDATPDNGFEGNRQTDWLKPIYEAMDKFIGTSYSVSDCPHQSTVQTGAAHQNFFEEPKL